MFQGFPGACLNIRIPCNHLPHRQESMGLPKFLMNLFLHATACGLRWFSISLAIAVDLVLPSDAVIPWATTTNPISELYQHFRRRGSPYSLQDSLSTLHLDCSPHSARLRLRRKTRYGWMASPFPTGTFTLQDSPSFAWRETAMGLTCRFFGQVVTLVGTRRNLSLHYQ